MLVSLALTAFVFALLTLSTIPKQGVPPNVLFMFVLFMVFICALSGSMNQNGLFAYVSGFSQPAYTQAILAGQALSGVLPSIVQLLSVLAVPDTTIHEADELANAEKSAFGFFLTATLICGSAFLAFLYLHHFQTKRTRCTPDEDMDASASEMPLTKKSVSLLTLLRKTWWLSLALLLCFCVTMAFPVFAAQIQSVNREKPQPRYSQPGVFVALALLFWNSGDLLGRMMILLPSLKDRKPPQFVLFILALARILFIPLFLMCNVRGRGATINSDLFYLVLVQGLFGLTNGYICVSIMVSTPNLVDKEEREAAGAYMGMLIVAGLAAGSVLSFFIGAL